MSNKILCPECGNQALSIVVDITGKIELGVDRADADDVTDYFALPGGRYINYRPFDPHEIKCHHCSTSWKGTRFDDIILQEGDDEKETDADSS